MKVMILETILNTIQADLSLKTNEKEWLLFFSHWIYWVNTNRYTNQEYITLTSDYLAKIFGKNYNVILNYFEKNNWIIIYKSANGGKSYTVRYESTKYNITLPIDCNLTLYEFKSKTVINKIKKVKTGEIRKEFATKKIEAKEAYYNEIETFDYLIALEADYRKVLDKVTTTIPQQLLDEIELTKTKIEELTNKKPFKYIIKQIKEENKKLTTLLQEKHKLQDFNTENEFKSCTIDSFGFRMHTSFTRLKKQFRANIKLNNKKMTGIDVVNAQPWLLSVQPEITNKQFKMVCQNGTFYDLFVTNEVTRDEVKIVMYRIFFGGYQESIHAYNQDITNPKSVLSQFIKLFPDVWSFIQATNAIDHKNLSQLLQRAETDLMLYTVWKELNVKQIDCLTLHDALYIEDVNLNVTLEILKQAILKKGYELPSLKIEKFED